MLLAVDIGNTNIKFGVFDDERLVFKISIPTLRNVTAVGLANVLRDRLTQDINSAIICSVVHDVDPAIRDFVENGYGMTPLFVSNDADFGLKINYEPLSSLGTDRLVNAFAAVEKYGIPCTVCSFGTATTIDVVRPKAYFLAGLSRRAWKRWQRPWN